MPAQRRLTRNTIIQFPTLTQFWSILIISVCLQLIIAVSFGHDYDMRIFMATGYLVATGENPYNPQDLTSVFNDSGFQGMTSVGYLPPWPLVLGFIYLIVYQLIPNFFLYNLAIKIPIIAANIGLAFLVIKILERLDAGRKAIRGAWIFMLLNPFVLYFSTSWGQIDSIVALLSLYSLLLLYTGKSNGAAITLALAISIKPTALPFFIVTFIYLARKSPRDAASYSILFLVSVFLFSVVPFFLLGWDPSPIFHGWNAHFTVGGAMSFMTFWELLEDTYQLTGYWWLTGLLWIPVLAVFSLRALNDGIDGFEGLLIKSTGLVLVFFLTRSWLSEPNIILVLPLILILTSIGKLNHIALVAVWTLPFIFTIFNLSPPQLLFPIFPELMQKILSLADTFRDVRLVVRTLLVIPWLITGWWIVLVCFKRDPYQKKFSWR